MPLYFFRISDGHYAGASDKGSEFASREAAWTEMTKVCGNLLGSLSRGLASDAQILAADRSNRQRVRRSEPVLHLRATRGLHEPLR